MPSLELCPLSEHLDDSDIEQLASDVSGIEDLDDDEFEPVPIEQDYDDDVFVDFWDQLEANDAACDIYLPLEFEDVLDLSGKKVGSAHALLVVLANLKEDMFLDEDEQEEEDDDAIEDIDDELDEFDDYGAEDESYSGDEDDDDLEVKDEQLRRVWRALHKAAKTAIDRKLALFVHD